MAVSTATVLVTNTSTATTSTLVSDTFGPSANALVFAHYFTSNPTATSYALSISDSFLVGGLSAWTSVYDVHFTGSGQVAAHVAIWRAQANALPGVGTVLVSIAGSGTNHILTICNVTGHDTATPIVETGSLLNTAATGTITLTDVAAGNIVVGFATKMGTGTDLIGSGANYREIYNVLSVSGGVNGSAVSQAQDGTATLITWTSLSARKNIMFAVEIAVTASGSAPAFQLERIEHRFLRGMGRGLMRGVA